MNGKCLHPITMPFYAKTSYDPCSCMYNPVFKGSRRTKSSVFKWFSGCQPICPQAILLSFGSTCIMSLEGKYMRFLTQPKPHSSARRRIKRTVKWPNWRPAGNNLACHSTELGSRSRSVGEHRFQTIGQQFQQMKMHYQLFRGRHHLLQISPIMGIADLTGWSTNRIIVFRSAMSRLFESPYHSVLPCCHLVKSSWNPKFSLSQKGVYVLLA